MNIEIRHVRPEDYRRVEEVTREAFWGFMRPESDEHYLVHLIHNSPAYIPQLDFLALSDGEIVGNIIYTTSKIQCDSGQTIHTITFGPLSVLPAYQSKGIGMMLLKHSIQEAIRLRYTAILIFGHPDYYTKAGFVPAEKFGITTSRGDSFDAFMALPLFEDALLSAHGRYYEDEIFEIDKAAAHQFDKGFPRKRVIQIPEIDDLLNSLSKAAATALKKRKVRNVADLLQYSTRELLEMPGISEAELIKINEKMKSVGYPQKPLP